MSHSGDDFAVGDERDVHGEQRQPAKEVRGAVQWVDDPGKAFVAPLEEATFLAEEAIVGICGREGLLQRGLGAQVSRGNRIWTDLTLDLERRSREEIFAQPFAGEASSVDHRR